MDKQVLGQHRRETYVIPTHCYYYQELSFSFPPPSLSLLLNTTGPLLVLQKTGEGGTRGPISPVFGKLRAGVAASPVPELVVVEREKESG